MINIKKIPLSKMTLMQTGAFMSHVTRIIGEHAPEALRLTDTYKLLLEQEINTQLLTPPYGWHPLTKAINQLYSERLTYAAVISMNMRAFNKLNNEPQTQHYMEVAYPVMNSYLPYIRQNNNEIIESLIKGFLNHLETEPEVKEAFIRLGFKSYIDGLEKTNKKCSKLITERLAQIAKRPKHDKKGIAKRAQAVIRMAFDQINHYQESFTELDYSPLISELNELLSLYSKDINTRASTNKRRNKKKKEAIEINEEQLKIVLTKDDATKAKTNPVNANQRTNLPTIIEKAHNNEALQNMVKVLKKPDGDNGEP